MPSWQARCSTVVIRVLMRRLTWGDDRALARRARRVFGAPDPLQWLRTRDVRIDAVHEARVALQQAAGFINAPAVVAR